MIENTTEIMTGSVEEGVIEIETGREIGTETVTVEEMKEIMDGIETGKAGTVIGGTGIVVGGGGATQGVEAGVGIGRIVIGIMMMKTGGGGMEGTEALALEEVGQTRKNHQRKRRKRKRRKMMELIIQILKLLKLTGYVRHLV